MSEPVADIADCATLLASDDPVEREEAARSLAERPTAAAVPLLLRALADQAESVRMWGAYGLGMLRRNELKARLREAMLGDRSVLVRLWATFGLVNLGEKAEVATLLSFLDDESLDVKNNAADALVSLALPDAVRPHLEKHLTSSDARKRAWAAGILHRLGHPSALEIWKACLADFDSRLDAAVVAPHLREPSAAREVLEALNRLPPADLTHLVPQAGDIPAAEVMSAPLLDMGLEQLFEAAQNDATLRRELVLLLCRSTAADPELVGRVHQFLGTFDAGLLAEDVAKVLEARPDDERADCLAQFAPYVPDAVVPALERLEVELRERLFDAIAEAVQRDEARGQFLPVLELLLASRWAEQFADVKLPDDMALEDADTLSGERTIESPLASVKGDGHDDEQMAELVERLVSGERLEPDERARVDAYLRELEMTPEELLEHLSGEEQASPPGPEEAAARALCLAATLERLAIEERLQSGASSPREAQHQANEILRWLQSEHLFDALTELERQLHEIPAGEWTEDDRLDVSWSAEGLSVLLWALGKAALPGPDAPADLPPLLEKLPLLSETAAWRTDAELRPTDELEAQREAYELWHWRAEQEIAARSAGDGDGEREVLKLDELIRELEREGFDATAAGERGQTALVAEALRFASQRAAKMLVERGLLSHTVGDDFPFRGRAFHQLDDDGLANAMSLSLERHRAFAWLCRGGDWDELMLDVP